MTDSPIKLRAGVSPTCRGSTGFSHNGWNPAPLAPSSRIASESSTFEAGVSRSDNHGWNPEWSESPISIRTCGVAHALHRCLLPRSRPPRPRWRFRHRPSRGFRRPSDTLLSNSRRAVGRLWGGFRFGNRRLGLLPAPAACSRRSSGVLPFPGGSVGSGSHVRSGPQGRFASLGRSLAHATGLDPLRHARLVFLGCRGRGSSGETPGQSVARRPNCLPFLDPAPGGRGASHRGPHRVCPFRSSLHRTVRGSCRGPLRSPVIFQFSSFGGICP